MADRDDLESAILDAEGAAAVLAILEEHLESSLIEGWKTLKLEPREDLSCIVMLPKERLALDYASRNLEQTVAEVSRAFYAASRAGTL